jgi:putative oxidoreductase
MASDPVSSALLLLRLIVGAVFLAHGIKHAMGRERTTKWFASLGFKAPGLQWMMSTATEIGAGLLLILGLLTGPAAMAIVATMFVAYWVNHRPAGFFITAFMKEGVDVEGYEYVLTLAVAAAALAVAGPGEFSIDWGIELDGVPVASLLDGWVGALLAVGGIAAAAGQLATFWRPNAD